MRGLSLLDAAFLNFDNSGNIPATLVAYYRLEADGTDYVGANTVGNNGVGFVTGQVDNAASFDGSVNYWLERTSTPDLYMAGQSFGVACWVKLSSLARNQPLINKDNDAVHTQLEFGLNWIAINNDFEFFISTNADSESGQSAHSTVSISANTWYLIIGWYDAVTKRLNIQINNNAPENTGSDVDPPAVFTVPNNFRLGKSLFIHTNCLLGFLDEVAIFKGVPSSAQRAAMWNGGSGAHLA